ncbi:MAG: replication initiation protein [Cetobacterium sp.]|nr:replication initiation protein [Cetobacterium sp.]
MESEYMSNTFFKPSLTIATSVPLSSQQLDVYNYLLQQAYLQLQSDEHRTVFIFTVDELKTISNGRLDSRNKIEEFFNDLFDKEFHFNILGKDKSIESKLKSRFISLIEQKKDGTIGLGLEIKTIELLRNMVLNKRNFLKKDENSKIEFGSYTKLNLSDHKKIKFYPAKVAYEVIKDYEGYPVPEIPIDDFKLMTDTVNKYLNNYPSLVIKKTIKIINETFEGINFDIKIIKSGKYIKALRLTSDLNPNRRNLKVSFEEIKSEFKEFLKEGGLDPECNYPKSVLEGFLKSKNYELK